MFIEEVKQQDDVLKISVTISERRYALEEKLIYSGDPELLIPEDLKGMVKLISSPEKKISNMKKSKYLQTGTWIYQIEKPKKTETTKTTTKRRATKSTTSQKKRSTNSRSRATITKVSKKI